MIPSITQKATVNNCSIPFHNKNNCSYSWPWKPLLIITWENKQMSKKQKIIIVIINFKTEITKIENRKNKELVKRERVERDRVVGCCLWQLIGGVRKK